MFQVNVSLLYPHENTKKRSMFIGGYKVKHLQEMG